VRGQERKGQHWNLINNPAWIDGVFVKALSFDEASSFVQTPDGSSLDVTTQVTVSAWSALR